MWLKKSKKSIKSIKSDQPPETVLFSELEYELEEGGIMLAEQYIRALQSYEDPETLLILKEKLQEVLNILKKNIIPERLYQLAEESYEQSKSQDPAIATPEKHDNYVTNFLVNKVNEIKDYLETKIASLESAF